MTETEGGFADKMLWAGLACGLLLATPLSFSAEKPLALVYDGEGACPEGCAAAAASAAALAGYETQFVGAMGSASGVFAEARVWIQPGGSSSQAAAAMSEPLKEAIRDFVSLGGRYVGFCAGGFLATAEISDLKIAGLGILPGTNAHYLDEEGGKILQVSWEGASRFLYWEGGPYFVPPSGQVAEAANYEVLGRYPDGRIASVAARFGLGQVIVTGLHPEAPRFWKDYYHLSDPDGDDFDLAAAMIQGR